MISSSYLFKDVYKQHWGEDFVRGAEEDARHQPPAKGSLLHAMRTVVVRAFARTTHVQGPAKATEARASEPHRSALPA